VLQIGAAQFKPRRAAIYNAAERRPMAFAKAGDREELTKGVSGHRFAHLSWWTNLNGSFRG
jgi:hypothetical protein